ncbi:helix-turn-helix transcriptional regulator [Gemella sp. GH3]|uniref:helix-turn-helix domain-containing protein n=1 Tax=unclassified Gemella TaxID=2624949 RepID=UPI0015D09048|nr:MULTISPECIES: helix-turn-helix transcriptional regulator [unclassified Gemella]MBF0714535.1 helix-turn-helix transcriptional regulator [Gemella sp. GH3.1]NYS51487.1 helix-turn-helix transcriptional regulator [Gemella sp. GH3]
MKDFIDKHLDKKNMTYYNLSKTTGIHKNILYDFKRGSRKLSFEKLCLISNILEFSMDDLKEYLDNCD